MRSWPFESQICLLIIDLSIVYNNIEYQELVLHLPLLNVIKFWVTQPMFQGPPVNNGPLNSLPPLPLLGTRVFTKARSYFCYFLHVCLIIHIALLKEPLGNYLSLLESFLSPQVPSSLSQTQYHLFIGEPFST